MGQKNYPPQTNEGVQTQCGDDYAKYIIYSEHSTP